MPVTIACNKSGFSLDTVPANSTQWSDVTEITAFKRDILTTDKICLRFQLDDGSCIEANEEMFGFRQFTENVTAKFGLASTWWSDVAFPAFKTNVSTIWRAPKKSFTVVQHAFPLGAIGQLRSLPTGVGLSTRSSVAAHFVRSV